MTEKRDNFWAASILWDMHKRIVKLCEAPEVGFTRTFYERQNACAVMGKMVAARFRDAGMPEPSDD